ncbi:MAG: hypothetical protein M1835_000562 [Candelina submexicana]|nr:MAG: hypothetical protein M1835_000562 [Candelina submexicana]
MERNGNPSTSDDELVVEDKLSKRRDQMSTESENTPPASGIGRNNEHFSFEKLPAELRNKIYSFVIGEDTEIYIHALNKDPTIKNIQTPHIDETLPIIVYIQVSEGKGNDADQKCVASLLFTSRKIALEFAPFVYNRFHHFVGHNHIVPCLLYQPSWALAHIKGIYLQTDELNPDLMRPFREFCKMIRKEMKLERLIVRVRMVGELDVHEVVIEDYLETREWARQLVKIKGLKQIVLALGPDDYPDPLDPDFEVFSKEFGEFTKELTQLMTERICISPSKERNEVTQMGIHVDSP